MRVRSDAKRTAILATAGQLFLQYGYGSLTMNAIAAAVGGSKQTLYGYFSSKENLFSAFITEHTERVFCGFSDGNQPQDKDLTDALFLLGKRYVTFLLAADTIAISRLVIAENGNIPKITDVFYNSGPKVLIAQIAGMLAKLGVTFHEPGLMEADAAIHFNALCSAGIQDRRLWGIKQNDTSESLDEHIRSAVRRFLLGAKR